MELVAGVAQQAVPVLHRDRGLAEVVVLHRRDADDLGGLAEGAVEHLPGVRDRLAADVELLEVAVLGAASARPRRGAAASPTLVLKKQLSGLLIGLSQTITLRAPAPGRA